LKFSPFLFLFQRNLVASSFSIRPIKKKLENSSDYLVYEFTFSPNKPFKQTLDFIIVRQTGGQWKYKINLLSLEPEINDTITIFSLLNKTSSV